MNKANQQRMTSDDADGRFQQFKRSAATITGGQLRAIDRYFDRDDDGRHRRMALAMLTRSGADLAAMGNESREAALVLAQASEAAAAVARRLREVADLLDSAQARTLTALVERPDMWDVVAEARAE